MEIIFNNIAHKRGCKRSLNVDLFALKPTIRFTSQIDAFRLRNSILSDLMAYLTKIATFPLQFSVISFKLKQNEWKRRWLLVFTFILIFKEFQS